ncbi:ATP-dependent DNA helicase [Halioglobus maricola]|nr:ATP-dependent DNA helicase [Halioglobus maricola]
MTEIAVTVRDLVAFCHRRGDIDHRFTPSPTAAQGIEGHQRIYRRRPESYRREFPVEYRRQFGDISLLVRGRADGYDPDIGLVEEIKTCRVDPEDIPATISQLHMAQAKTYAAIIARAEDVDALKVRLSWLDIDRDEETRIDETCTRGELDVFLEETLRDFASWLTLLARSRRRRDVSLAGLAFPHGEFRPGQRDIAELVYKCVDQGGELMVEAPTGIGKTAAAMYPALRALERGKHEGVVFATARTVGRRAAEECLQLLADAGLEMPWLSLTAKDSICFSPGKACHAQDCPYADGYYDRLGDALRAAVSHGALSRAGIEDIAREHSVCPYQLADDLLPWVDMVVADLHYLYSLYPRLGLLAQQEGRRFTVLLDEAHNLPERARGMYSAALAKSQLMRVKKGAAKPVRRALERLNRCLLALQKEQWAEEDCDYRQTLPDKLEFTLLDFVAATGEQLAEEPALFQRVPEHGDFYFKVLHWLRVSEHWGDDFVFELQRGAGEQGLMLSLNCLDPSRLLAGGHDRLHASVAFSATLSPAYWMRQMLGFGDDAVCRRLDSPFEPDQLDVQLVSTVDTRYSARAGSLNSLAEHIQRWLESTEGNCIVYFSSYAYMRDALALIDIGARSLWQQEPGLDHSAREALLTDFTEKRDLVAFCILGGVFGEGIDLPGDQLRGVAVVGVGLPQVGRERERLRAWYQQKYGQGFEYAYLYPGMQKVDQALGRVVRTAQDQGRALLVDARYSWKQYRDLLPPWWKYHD